MKQTKTAAQMLAQIEKDFFKGVDLAGASLLEGNERRACRLAQVERLLSAEQHDSLSMAMRLSDMFWTADEGRVPTEPANPLLSLTEERMVPDRQPLTEEQMSTDRLSLTGEEMRRLRLILEVAGLCHDLSLHFAFDLKETLGIRKNDFRVSNRQLVAWLTATAYEQIAMHTAYIMKKQAAGMYESRHYLPAQDEVAEIFSAEHRELVRQPDSTRMPARDYVGTILDALLQIERHWQRGRRLKLKPDLVMLHDEIFGVVPRRFDKVVLKAAQALYDYMDTQLVGRLLMEDFDVTTAFWSDMPEHVRRNWDDTMSRFAEKVREVRSQYLGEGWLTDDSLAFGYLMTHAEWCGQGWWRKEDKAL